MNDPHVEKLHYRIKHDQVVNYDKANPLVHETPLITARIEGDRATLEMREHFASEEEAKAAVAPFLRAWEVWAGLEHGPGEFEFTYLSCDMIDRKPPPGQVLVVAVGTVHVEGLAPSVRIDRGNYPEAHDNFEVGPDVELMYGRYKQYREGKESLGSFANFVYTAVKGGSRGQQTAAARRLGIDNPVLGTLNTLSAEKGGPSDARKYEGAATDYTREERRWLQEAVRVIIRRAGEVAADPSRSKPVITMDDLPPL